MVTQISTQRGSLSAIPSFFPKKSLPDNSDIKLAFQYARQAAINAGNTDLKLFYNDYGHEYSKTKTDSIAALVKRLYNEPLIGGQHIIDGVGLQMHTNYARLTDDTGTQGNIEYAIEKMQQTGLKVHISELDISVTNRNDGTTQADREAAQQYRYFYIAQKYRYIVPASQRWGITLWNIGDADSSLGVGAAATLYNIDYSRKYAYQRFYEGLNQAISIQ
ncbi:endo-1,4-beta-xylanase [Mucilaginibacter sp. P25]|uniref:endo-1,4-beta-xylanase n=1 Tax=unclassified Mucilaginibacter TaxID=2617802 RepID=UPI000B8203E5